MKWFEYRHVVAFAETNLVGNVYYSHHVDWQGRCREMFLREHAPDLVGLLEGELALVTTRCGCEYFEELRAFDEVVIRMRLGSLAAHRAVMLFEYVRDGTVVAQGEQEVACMRRRDGRMVPAPFPASLQEAFERYTS